MKTIIRGGDYLLTIKCLHEEEEEEENKLKMASWTHLKELSTAMMCKNISFQAQVNHHIWSPVGLQPVHSCNKIQTWEFRYPNNKHQSSSNDKDYDKKKQNKTLHYTLTLIITKEGLLWCCKHGNFLSQTAMKNLEESFISASAGMYLLTSWSPKSWISLRKRRVWNATLHRKRWYSTRSGGSKLCSNQPYPTPEKQIIATKGTRGFVAYFKV